MSSIAGFCSGDALLLDSMLDALEHWQPDRRTCYHDADISLGCLELFNTPESAHDPQPFVTDRLVITADCRLDNRSELAKACGLEHPDSISDTHYIALAYARWGQACVNHLYGDFAFVLWDKQTRTFFGARDHLGIKTLYYTVADNKFVFSSEIKGLLVHAPAGRSVNELYFIRAFSTSALPVTVTPYSDILLLAPGTSFEWKNGEFLTHTYWSPGCRKIKPPITREEQIDTFNQLLHEAVRCRLRTNRKVGGEVSGGLDSTGIAAIAMEVLGQGAEFHSYLYGKAKKSVHSYDQLDDRSVVIEFCERYGIRDYLRVLDEDDFPLELAMELMEEVYDDHEMNGVPLTGGAMLALAKEAGVGVVLSGHGGDHVVTERTAHFCNQASEKKAYKELWSGLVVHRNVVASSLLFAAYAARGLIRGSKIRKDFSRTTDKVLKQSGLKNEFIVKYGLPELPDDSEILHYQSTRCARFKANLTLAYMQKRAYHHELTAKHFNAEYRFPLLDIRLIDYVMSLPEQLIAPPGKPRYLYSRAVQDYIPHRIVDVEKSNSASVPFIKSFFRSHSLALTELTKSLLAKSDFGAYFENKKIAEVTLKPNLKFLSLLSVYVRAQKHVMKK